MRFFGIFTVALLAAVALHGATITSGTALFTISDTSGFDTSPSADFQFIVPTDHLFEYGWWVRGPGETPESVMGVPGVGTAGNVMTLTYAALPGTSALVSGVMVLTLVQSGAVATLDSALTLTNNADALIALSLFNMVDVDLAGAGSDSATGGLGGITITDPSGRALVYTGAGALAFLVRQFGATDVGAVLSDASTTNFDNSGLPFGPGDITLGYQWDVTIGPGQSTTINSQLLNSLDPLGVPEPATVSLFGAGLAAVALLSRRRR